VLATVDQDEKILMHRDAQWLPPFRVPQG